MRKVKPSQVDRCPAYGELLAVRERAKRLWTMIRDRRERLKREPLNGNRTGIRLELIELQSGHSQCKIDERAALRAIERRANECGETIGFVEG